MIRHQNDAAAQRALLAPEKAWYVSAAVMADDIALHIKYGTQLDTAFFENHESQSELRLPSRECDQLMEECMAAVSEMQSVFAL